MVNPTPGQYCDKTHLVNPPLFAVRGLSPHLWKIDGGKVVPIRGGARKTKAVVSNDIIQEELGHMSDQLASLQSSHKRFKLVSTLSWLPAVIFLIWKAIS